MRMDRTVSLALDISNDQPIPDPKAVECWRSGGYQTLIVGASWGVVATLQLQAAAQGGMGIEAYAWVNFTVGGGWQSLIDHALSAIRTQPVRRLWLDCEGNADGSGRSDLDVPGTIGRIRDAMEYVAAKRPDLPQGVYTGGPFWRTYTGNTHEFAEYPLWIADYRIHADPPPDPTQAPTCGGWDTPTLWQYAGSTETCGIDCDRSIRVKEDEMKSFVCWCPDYAGGSVWFVGPNGAKWITDPAIVTELEGQFGKMTTALSAKTLNTIGA